MKTSGHLQAIKLVLTFAKQHRTRSLGADDKGAEVDGMKNESSVNRTMPRLALWGAAVLGITTLQTNAHAQKLTSFSDSSGKNVIFQGNDFDVHDLFCAAGSNCDVAASWSNENVTMTTATVAAGNFNNFTSFSDAVGQHVFFVDGNQRLHQFLKGSSGIWGNADPGVLTYGGINAYSANGIERVFYETGDQHVHMVASTNGTSWGDADLTKMTTGHLAAWGTRFTSFNDSTGEHAFFVDTNGHVNQLYGYHYTIFRCTIFGCGPVTIIRWVDQDLTASATGNPMLASSGALSSFSDNLGDHVFYEDFAQHVHQLLTGSSGWADQDLSATAWPVTVVQVMNFGLTSYANPGSEIAYYVGTDSNLYLLISNRVTVFPNGSMWEAGNITTLTHPFSPLISSCGGPDLTGFTEVNGNQLSDEVFYVANDGDLHRQWAGLGWQDINLTAGQVFSELPRNFCIN